MKNILLAAAAVIALVAPAAAQNFSFDNEYNGASYKGFASFDNFGSSRTFLNTTGPTSGEQFSRGSATGGSTVRADYSNTAGRSALAASNADTTSETRTTFAASGESSRNAGGSSTYGAGGVANVTATEATRAVVDGRAGSFTGIDAKTNTGIVGAGTNTMVGEYGAKSNSFYGGLYSSTGSVPSTTPGAAPVNNFSEAGTFSSATGSLMGNTTMTGNGSTFATGSGTSRASGYGNVVYSNTGVVAH